MSDSEKDTAAGIWMALRDTLEAHNAPDQVVESVREAARSLNMSTEEIEYIKKEWVFCEGYKRIFNMIFGEGEHDDRTNDNKTILDPCCGGRMFYFNKNHPNIVYLDKRSEKVEMVDRGVTRTLEIAPDRIADFTDLEFADNTFNFVVFDPPHLIKCGKNSWLAKKYGKLDKDSYKEVLNKGLNECIRVVKPGCVVAMKWSERDIKTTELLKIVTAKPDFGDKSGPTRWLFFVKEIGTTRETLLDYDEDYERYIDDNYAEVFLLHGEEEI